MRCLRPTKRWWLYLIIAWTDFGLLLNLTAHKFRLFFTVNLWRFIVHCFSIKCTIWISDIICARANPCSSLRSGQLFSINFRTENTLLFLLYLLSFWFLLMWVVLSVTLMIKFRVDMLIIWLLMLMLRVWDN